MIAIATLIKKKFMGQKQAEKINAAKLVDGNVKKEIKQEEKERRKNSLQRTKKWKRKTIQFYTIFHTDVQTNHK